MDPKLWDVANWIDNARDAVRHAADLAYRASGHDPGMQADPEHGVPEIPAVDGWPEMLRLHGQLVLIRDLLGSLVSEEIRKAIEDEREYLDSMER